MATNQQYEKVRVQNFSLTTMQDNGFDIEDGSDIEAKFLDLLVKRGIMQMMTRRQQQVVICLAKGYDRLEIANHLLISKQSVNQIIPRIRKRLEAHGIRYVNFNNRGAKSRIPLLSN